MRPPSPEVEIAVYPLVKAAGVEFFRNPSAHVRQVGSVGPVDVVILEGETEKSLIADLEIFFARYVDERITVAGYQSDSPGSAEGIAVLRRMLPEIPVLTAKVKRADQFAPFRASINKNGKPRKSRYSKFAGHTYERFAPHWYVKEYQAVTLLRGVNIDAYRCPEPPDGPEIKQPKPEQEADEPITADGNIFPKDKTP